MAPLPKPISRASAALESAIAEGRAEEALQKLVHALREKGDDRAVRNLAADWIERIGLPDGATKKLRQGQPALLEDWLDIADMMTDLQTTMIYTDAVAQTAKHFGCSERHVQKCVAAWRRAEAESRQP